MAFWHQSFDLLCHFENFPRRFYVSKNVINLPLGPLGVFFFLRDGCWVDDWLG